MLSGREKSLFQKICNCRLTRAGDASEPQHAGSLALEVRARGLGHIERLPLDIIRTAQRILNQTSTHGLVAEPIDKDEASCLAVLALRIEGNPLVQPQVTHADLVKLQGLRGQMIECINADLVLK